MKLGYQYRSFSGLSCPLEPSWYLLNFIHNSNYIPYFHIAVNTGVHSCNYFGVFVHDALTFDKSVDDKYITRIYQ